jgi:F-type H+-transporting ATPase subunit b
MFSAAKALAGSAWDKLIKLWRQFCQWVDKYVGTYPRLLKAVLAMRSNAKTIEGKRKEESKLDITSNIKMLAVPKTGGSAEPEYLTKAADLVRFANAFGAQAKDMVDTQRSTEEEINTFAQTLGGLDFSTAEDAKKSIGEINVNEFTKIKVGSKEWHQYTAITGGKYKDRDGVTVHEYAVLPGYQRIITFGYMVNDSKAFIDESLKKAHEANEKLANIQKEGESILQEAREKQAALLKEAAETRDAIVEKAQDKAREEGARLLSDAKKQIETEKQNAIREIRGQVAELSVQIAEKVLKAKLSDDKAQMDMINRLLDEVSSDNK